MGDLISRSRLKEELKSWAWLITKPQYYHREDADFVIDSQAAVDAVEVVRCKDCAWGVVSARNPLIKWCNKHATHFRDNDFCSYGERKEQ